MNFDNPFKSSSINWQDLPKSKNNMKNEIIKDDINHPSHYAQGSIECIDAMIAAKGKEAVINFAELSAFKYLWRSDIKENKIKDLKKAKWYIEKVIELTETK